MDENDFLFDPYDKSPIQVFYSKLKHVTEMYDILEKKFQSEIDTVNHYHSGDIAARISSKWDKYVGKVSFENFLKNLLVTPIAHGAKIYRGTPTPRSKVLSCNHTLLKDIKMKVLI